MLTNRQTSMLEEQVVEMQAFGISTRNRTSRTGVSWTWLCTTCFLFTTWLLTQMSIVIDLSLKIDIFASRISGCCLLGALCTTSAADTLLVHKAQSRRHPEMRLANTSILGDKAATKDICNKSHVVNRNHVVHTHVVYSSLLQLLLSIVCKIINWTEYNIIFEVWIVMDMTHPTKINEILFTCFGLFHYLVSANDINAARHAT